MVLDDYSENIDWDKVYSAFHESKRIAARIRDELGHFDVPLIFCGFPEVASHLSAHSKILFVDNSPTITARSRTRYPNIDKVSNEDIFKVLKGNHSDQVVISCRLSAFWQSSEAFEELAESILAHPRKQVLIDFFDHELIKDVDKINFKSDAGKGSWCLKPSDEHHSNNPPIHLVRMDIAYELDGLSFSYETCRAFFQKAAIEAWCNSAFKEYTVSLTASLLFDDPSFTIKMIRA